MFFEQNDSSQNGKPDEHYTSESHLFSLSDSFTTSLQDLKQLHNRENVYTPADQIPNLSLLSPDGGISITSGKSKDMQPNPNQPFSVLKLIESGGDISKAFELLKNTLGNGEAHENSARHILELLTSNQSEDKELGKKVICIMQNGSYSDRAMVLQILDFSNSIERRNELIKAMEDPATKQGVQVLMDWYSSAGRKERLAAADLVDMIGSPLGRDAGSAKQLLTLLGGNTEQQGIAKSIMLNINDRELREQMLKLLSNGEHADAAKKLVAMLQEDTQKAAVINLLAVFSTNNGAEAGIKLMRMLVSPSTRENASAILTNTDGPENAKMILELLSSRKNREAADELVKMLRSSNASEHLKANRLLGALGTSNASNNPEFNEIRGVDTRTQQLGFRLLEMLSTNEHREAAKQMLGKVENSTVLEKLLDMLEKPENRQLGETLLKMLDRESPTVHRMLENFNLEETKKCLDLLKGSPAAWHLKQLMAANSEGCKHLLKLLTSSDPSSVQAGEKALSLLGNTHHDLDTRQVLRAKLPPAETVKLLDLLTSNRPGARELLGLTSAETLQVPDEPSGVETLLKMLCSKDAAVRKDAERYLDMLSKQETRDQATGLLGTLNTEKSLRCMLAIKDNERTRAGAEKLTELLSSPNLATQFRARLLVSRLSSDSASEQRHGQQLLEMLSDPKQQDKAVRLISNVRYLENFMQLTDSSTAVTPEQKEIRQKLLDMLNNGDLRNLIKANTLVELLTGDSATTKAVTTLLMDKSRQQELSAILSLETGDRCAALIQLTNSPETSAAGKVLIELLKSGDNSKIQSVTALLDTQLSNDGQFRDGQGPYNQFIGLLNKPETRAIATKALLLAQEQALVNTVLKLMNRPGGSQMIEQLTELRKDPASKLMAETMLAELRSSESIAVVLKMLENPKQANLAKSLVAELSTADANFRNGTLRLLDLLGSSSTSALGTTLAEMLVNPTEKALAESILSSLNFLQLRNLSPTFLAHLRDKANSSSAAFVLELFQSDNSSDHRAIANLSSLLRSSDVKTQEEGKRLLNMLNSDKNRDDAIRKLKRFSFAGRAFDG
jgi:hypothetical protein